ncbi:MULTISPECIES: proline/glycine betaine ABC transporter permease [unclassified Oceanispirochaeta]|uniref:ABC transporter permease n=1 Tax=unclassified Oceanispirochaeta TaxID=2635722 RepID=UPI000E0912AC|nr:MULTISPECIES: proline/glycine betaine ABC transporter permease [unclassified Oceanispirochaeta]MBF9017281.1 proline/glycine betaine ABC transporter permease [Oceanispirochaeta sp. M2]NPD73791.1 proline/glycine betaine ABC transporter permease [Oceanispirochaeta sp. M1]RDG30394.1 proline/glycine betaine ABC transporter permease [Oceanispirochaeta sp. M1]
MNRIREIFDIGAGFEKIIEWLTEEADWLFDFIAFVVEGFLDGVNWLFHFPPSFVMIGLFSLLAWKVAGKGVALFTLIGFLLILYMGYWSETMDTLSLVFSAVIFGLLIGLPLGIWASRSDSVWKIMRPILDFMQTLPAFVYLIPAVLLFKLGPVPGVIATLIFSLPPVVRLTNLGIRQVPVEIHEACRAFGATPKQMLFKAELPVALPTIMAGVNQTIMLALSMVVISGMIGAGGLGNVVLKGITQLKIDMGFEGGICIVILAIFLDRVTQAFSTTQTR